MKIVKSILRGLFWVGVLCLLAAPVWLLSRISGEEMKQYEKTPAPVFRETAYGAVAKARRADVEVAVTVSGRCVSESFVYMELPAKTAQSVRWYVREGSEVRQGEPLGIVKGEELASEYTGVVREINVYAQEPYLRIQLPEPVELECRVDARTLRALERAGEELKTADGAAARLTYASLTRDGEGMVTVRLRIDGEELALGTEIRELKLLTGQRYLQALVLSAKCLYQKEEGSKDWYARRVTEDGVFLEEVKVEVGYSDGTMVCVSGVSEGDCFDTGYRPAASAGTGP